MPPVQSPSRRRRKAWIWTLVSISAALVVVLLLVASVIPISSDALRQRIVETLSDRLNGDVSLDGLQVRLFPRFHAEGFGLTVRQNHRQDVAPLIRIRTLTVDADLLGLVRKHIAAVSLDGLEITITPIPDKNQAQAAGTAAPPRTDGAATDNGANGDAPDAAAETADRGDESAGGMNDFVIDRLDSRDARLAIVPSSPDSHPKIWAIHQLAMRTVAFSRAMPFDATLTNAVPPGEIGTKGVFGPWNRDDPGATPLDGTFTFAHADLGVFKGISGILSAHGEFGGSLGRIGIHGETETPDFTIAVGGRPVPLHTDYHATVDGTNGNTLLDRIDGSFLNTSLVAKGGVVDTPGKDGRTVTLDITMDKARIEDILALVIKTPRAPMLGALKLKTRFVLPPGDKDVVDRLQLNGDFSIATARFTDLDIQNKVNELSHRGRGKNPDERQQNVASNFKGRFKYANAALSLPGFTFNTPGAGVQLAGLYRLRPQTLDFKGTLFMDAKISETQTGIKRVLLKVVDPLFRKEGGGSAIPIKINGKRSDPSFGLDRSRVFHRGD